MPRSDIKFFRYLCFEFRVFIRSELIASSEIDPYMVFFKTR